MYKTVIRPDEPMFVDMDRTLAMSAVETFIKQGTGPIKVIVASARLRDLSKVEFERAFLDNYARPILEEPSLSHALRGWSVNHIVEGSFMRPGAGIADGLPIDCVENFWFESQADMDAFFAALRSGLRGAVELFGERQSFVAEEFVLFDIRDGRKA